MTTIRFFRRTTSTCAVVGALLGLFVTNSAEAEVVTLSFDGTYDISGNVFGQTGTVPYHYDMDYDASLDNNPLFFPTGVSLGGLTTTNDWYGYSASGLVSSDFVFGTQTFTAADLIPLTPPGVEVSADLWFSADISLATPMFGWLFFEGGSPDVGSLELGGYVEIGDDISMDDTSVIKDLSALDRIGSSNALTIESSLDVDVDSDGDGVPDSLDECVDSNLSPTIVLNGCDSGVTNADLGNGCATLDLISACDIDAAQHGHYMQCVTFVTRDLRQAGAMRSVEAGPVLACAARR